MGKRAKIITALSVAGAFLLTALIMLTLLFPLFETVGAAQERYVCVWQNGNQTSEPYATCYREFVAAETDKIILERDGVTGEIETGAAYRKCFSVLSGGTLLQLLSLRVENVTRLERAVLFLTFGDTVYYSEEAFAFNGEKLEVTDRTVAKTVALVSGKFPAHFLKEVQAKTLLLFSEAELKSSDLAETQISKVVAAEPYLVSGGGIYLVAGDIKRLITALPFISSLTVDGDTDFCDNEALSPCKNLTFLSVPFVGSSRFGGREDDSPLFGYLFEETDSGYLLPENLKEVKITGGTISSFAFYGCNGLETVDARGVEIAQIAENAFSEPPTLNKIILSEEGDLAGYSCTGEEGSFVYKR